MQSNRTCCGLEVVVLFKAVSHFISHAVFVSADSHICRCFLLFSGSLLSMLQTEGQMTKIKVTDGKTKDTEACSRYKTCPCSTLQYTQTNSIPCWHILFGLCSPYNCVRAGDFEADLLNDSFHYVIVGLNGRMNDHLNLHTEEHQTETGGKW